MAGILIIGSANVDFIVQLPHLPALGETVTDGRFTQTYGGKGANQAVAVARAGGETTFITCLGDDPYAAPLLAAYQADGIDTRLVKIAPDVATGTALIMVDTQGDNYLGIAPGANSALLPADIDACAAYIRDAALVILQNEIPPATNQRVLEIAAEAGTPVVLNYAPVRGAALPVTPLLTGLVVNENEAAALTGLPVDTVAQARIAAAHLRALGPRYVILTLGAQGAWLDDGETQELVPAFPVTPVDATAAGDTFLGALAVALVEGSTLVPAARFACAASALTVTRVGAMPSIPWRAEIDAFLGAQG